MTTRQEIRNQILDEVNDTPDSSIYTTTRLNRLIEEVETEVASMWKWQFLRSKLLFRAPISCQLMEDITTATTDFDVSDATNFQTGTGSAVRILHDIINYTTINTDNLSVVTNIDVSHDESEAVHPLIQLPSNYQKLLEVYYAQGGVRSMREMMYVEEFSFDASTARLKYTILDSGSNRYLQISGVGQDDTVVVHYQMKPATYTSDTDVSSFPDEYSYAIARMVAGKARLLYDDDLDGMGSKLYEMGRDSILKMTKLYGEREQGMSRLVKSNYNSSRQDINQRYRNY